MTTSSIVLIVVVAVVAIVLIAAIAWVARNKRNQHRHVEAGKIRDQAREETLQSASGSKPRA
jgi:flagellar basal body-associated protein FliL